MLQCSNLARLNNINFSLTHHCA
uniref:Uncharacterized protein n=1 Tax=Anguilla anguilla TaxID=7936 RepID=A0A0E9VWH7_ANGAN